MPDDWSANDTMSVSRGTPGYKGNYFLKLTNTPTDVGMTISAKYDYIKDATYVGFACPYKPACLSGNFQYYITVKDTAYILVNLYRGVYDLSNPSGAIICGSGWLQITAGTQSTWSNFTIPINYYPPYSTPDSAYIAISAASNIGNSVVGNYLYIDNLHFCGSAEVKDVANETTLQIYPNPVVNELFIKPALPNDAVVKMYNYLGQLVYEGLGSRKIDTRNMANGVYTLIIMSENHQIIKREQIVKN